MQSESGQPLRRIALLAIVLAIAFGGLIWWAARPRPGASAALPDVPLGGDTASRMEAYRQLCRGKELAGAGEHQAALAVFESLVRAEGDSEYGIDADIQAAHSMALLGHHAAALARLEGVLGRCSDHEQRSRTRLTQADVHSLSGQHEKAISLLEALIVENTGLLALVCEDALVGMASVYQRQGQTGLVRAALDRIIADYPGSEEVRRRWALAQVARLRQEVAQRQQAAIQQLGEHHVVIAREQLDVGLTQWGASGENYLITAPLTIPTDATLRVAAGTKVRFGIFGGLRVEGRLDLAGEADRPVQLLPLSDDPATDWWAGIQVNGKNAAATLRHAQILGAERGIRAAGGLLELDHCVLDRCGTASIETKDQATLRLNACRIQNGYRAGIECGQGDTFRMSDSQITGMVTYGLILKEVADGAALLTTKIMRCGWDGVLVRGRSAPVIEGCVLAGNGGHGLRSIDGASPTVIDAQIEGNVGAGIHLEQRWDGAIRHSAIRENQGGGLVITVRCQGEMAGNLIAGNGKAGMQVAMDSTPAIIGNRFIANRGVGLLVQNAQPRTLAQNQFGSNEGPALRNESAAELQADRNWWGTHDEKAIAALIEDHRTNSAWGRVIFAPWLSEPPSDLGQPSVRSGDPPG